MDTKNDRKIKDLREEKIIRRGGKNTQKNYTKRSSVSSVHLLSCIWLFMTPWTAAHQASLSITNPWNLLKLMSIELVIPSNHLILCCHLLLPPSSRMKIQSWHTPFPIWNKSVAPCPVLTIASWPPYRFLRRQVKWSGIPISFRIFRSLWWSTQSKALA